MLSDGSRVPLDVIAVTTRVDARAGMVADLGLVPEEFAMGDLVLGTRIAADTTGHTSVAGVWAAGNATDPMAQVISSAAAGLMAGSQIHADLIADDTRAAVERQRASVPA